MSLTEQNTPQKAELRNTSTVVPAFTADSFELSNVSKCTVVFLLFFVTKGSDWSVCLLFGANEYKKGLRFSVIRF